MNAKFRLYIIICILCITAWPKVVFAQFGFTGGYIPNCDTVQFTANVTNGSIISPYSSILPPNLGPPFPSTVHVLSYLTINISSLNPEYLKITLTSPQGTTILLSEYLGAGGVNYTNCSFSQIGPSITTATAPFTGNWTPQDPIGLSAFDGENSTGIWTITVIDTSCDKTASGSGGSTSTGSWFSSGGSGSAGGSTISCSNVGCIPFDSYNSFVGCPDDTFNITNAFTYNIGQISSGSGQPFNISQITQSDIFSNSTTVYFNGLLCPATDIVEVIYPSYPYIADTNLTLGCNNYIRLDSIFDTQLTDSTNNGISFSGSYYSNGTLLSGSSLMVNTPGTYIIIRNFFGINCPDTTLITILPFPAPDAGPDQQVDFCNGSFVLLDTLYLSASYNITWDSSGTNLPNGYLVQSSGIYELIVGDTTACSDTAIYTFNTITAPNLGNDTILNGCIDSTLNLENLLPISSPTGIWLYNGAPIPSPIATNSNGIYTYIDNFSQYCNDTLQITLNTSVKPALGADIILSICDYEAINFDSLFNLNGLTAQWSLNSNIITSVDSIFQPGTYELIATNLSGCSDTVLVQVIVNTSPVLGADLQIDTCTNAPINLNQIILTTGLNLNWTVSGQIVNNPTTINNSGLYQLIATSNAGCIDTLLLQLNKNAVPVLGSDQNIGICYGDNFDLSTAYTISGATGQWWNNNLPFNSTIINTAGTYILIATTPQLCSDTATLTLSINPTPNIGNDTILTECANVATDLTTLYVTNPYISTWTYQGQPWQDPVNATSDGLYTLVLSSAFGCSDTAQVSIIHFPVPNVGTDTLLNFCEGDTINLNSYFNLQGLVSSWSLDGQVISNPAATTQSGAYMLIANDSNGCLDTAFVQLNLVPLPYIGNDTLVYTCEGSPINLTYLFNSSSFTVSWFYNQQSSTPPDSAINAGQYSILAINFAGCSTLTNINLVVHPKPQLGQDLKDSICSNEVRDLNSYFQLNGLTPSWTLNGNPVNVPENINAAGTYFIIATDINTCTDSASIELEVKEVPDLGNDLYYDLCPWHYVDFNSIYNRQPEPWKLWINGNLVVDKDSIRTPGIYLATAINTLGCTDSAYIEIKNRDCLCEAKIESKGNCIQEQIEYKILADSDIVQVHWDMNILGLPQSSGILATITYAEQGWKYINAELRLSCGLVQLSDSLFLTNCDTCQFYIPTAFTPNNDGKNDVFSFKGNCMPDQFRFAIYNRFGEMLYSTNDPSVGWNGEYNENPAPEGLYAYRIYYKLPYRNEQESSGVLHIIR
ncbi:MAG: gliding motility-associated C-terminal domain-containing protein [Bacteroidia bacterium]|nr:gliding motility-associated C-terminal domain-containing protein [Bacteroidia bacterium]